MFELKKVYDSFKRIDIKSNKVFVDLTKYLVLSTKYVRISKICIFNSERILVDSTKKIHWYAIYMYIKILFNLIIVSD